MSDFEKYLELYKERYQLNESPMQTGRHFGEDMDNNGYNFYATQQVLEENPTIDSFDGFGTKLMLVREPYSKTKFMDYWTTSKDSNLMTACYFIFEQINEGLQTLGVWNHVAFKGSCRKLLFEYYLQKYQFVISDSSHSDQAETYWKKIIKEGIQSGHKITVISRNEKEYEIEDSKSYWGRGPEFAQYRIKIYKKQTA